MGQQHEKGHHDLSPARNHLCGYLFTVMMPISSYCISSWTEIPAKPGSPCCCRKGTRSCRMLSGSHFANMESHAPGTTIARSCMAVSDTRNGPLQLHRVVEVM